VFLIQIHDETGLGGNGLVQAVADGTHAELTNRNSLLLRRGNGPGKFENQTIWTLHGFNRGSDRRTQGDFDADLTARREDFYLAYFDGTAVRQGR
jgi:hypothetical protein